LADNDVGIRLVAEDASFKTAMSNANQLIKQMAQECKEAVSGVSDLSTKQEAYTRMLDAQNQKLEVLNKAHEQAKEKLATLANELDRANEAGDPERIAKVSDAYTRQATEVSKLETQMSQCRTAINDTTSQLENMGTKTDEASESETKLGKATDDVKDKQSGFADALKKAGEALGGMAKQAASAAIDALKELGSAFLDVGKAALESYTQNEQLVGGVETLFGKSADIVKNYANEAYKTAGMSANQYLETVTGFSASLLQSVDKDTKKAAELANTAVKDMSDNANKMGTNIESIVSAYQGFAKQNYTMLDNLKLGYGGTKAEMERLLTDADKLSESFNLQKDAAGNLKYGYDDIVTAIHIVQENMGIAGTTAEEASKTIEGSTKAMQSAWDNLVTGIADKNSNMEQLVGNFVDSIITAGDNIIPRISEIIRGIADAVTEFVATGLPKLLEEIPRYIEELENPIIESVMIIVNAVGEALPQIVEMIKKILPDILETIKYIIPDIVKLGGEVLEALVKGITDSIPALIEAAKELLTELIQAFTDGLPEILKLGAELIKAIADGLSEALPDLIGMLPELIEAIVTGIADNLGTLLDAGIEIVTAIADGIVEALPEMVERLPAIIESIVQAIADNLPKLLEAGLQIVLSLAEAIITSLPKLIEAIPQIIDSIIKAFTGVDFKEIGDHIWTGVTKVFDSVGTFFGTVVSDIKKAFDGIGDWFGTTFSGARDKIKSCFEKIGSWFGDRWKDVQNALGDADEWMGKTFGDAWTEVKESFSHFVDFFKDVWENVKQIFSAVESVFKGDFEGAYNAVKGVWDNATSFFKGIWEGICNVFSGAFNAFSDIGKNIIEGIKKGISNAWNGFKNWFGGLFDGLIKGVEGIFKIGSPSKVMAEIGGNVVKGFANGMRQNAGLIDKAAERTFGNVTDLAYINPSVASAFQSVNGVTGINGRNESTIQQPIYLQIDGKTFARIATPYIDTQQGKNWSRQIALGVTA